MTDFYINLDNIDEPNRPAIENIQWHKPARALGVHQMLKAQDRPVKASARILMSYGLAGETSWRHGDADISGIDTADLYSVGEGVLSYSVPFPPLTLERELHAVEDVPITPGCVLELRVVAISAGATFGTYQSGGADEPVNTGTSGAIRMDVDWASGDGSSTDSVATTIEFPGESAASGSLADSEAAVWGAMVERSATNRPSSLAVSKSGISTWSATGTTVSITLTAVGNVRIVDAAVVEVPAFYGRDDGIPVGPAHPYGDTGSQLASFPDEYPIEGPSSGDRRFGAQHTLNVAARHELDLGPALFSWTAVREGLYRAPSAWSPFSSPPTMTEEPWVVDGTTETTLGEADTGTSSTAPRVSVAAGAYGRQSDTGDADLLMSEQGVCPTLFGAYMAVEGGTGTLTFSATDASEMSLSTTSTSYAWTHGITHLACGFHPLDDADAYLTAVNSGANETRVRYVFATYWPGEF